MPTLLSAHCRRYYTHPQPPATEPLEPPSRRRTSPPSAGAQKESALKAHRFQGAPSTQSRDRTGMPCGTGV